MSADLKPKDPIEIKFSYKAMVLGIILFALAFWIIGTVFRYYVYVGGSV